jgi:hypothetical protein
MSMSMSKSKSMSMSKKPMSPKLNGSEAPGSVLHLFPPVPLLHRGKSEH